MRKCPKCGELNGDNNTSCYQCGAVIGPVSSYQKICPKCKKIYSDRADTCEDCHVPLTMYTKDLTYDSDKGSNFWMYIVAVLLPLIGIILGLIYLARKEDSVGKNVLITAIVAGVIWFAIGLALAGGF